MAAPEEMSSSVNISCENIAEKSFAIHSAITLVKRLLK